MANWHSSSKHLNYATLPATKFVPLPHLLRWHYCQVPNANWFSSLSSISTLLAVLSISQKNWMHNFLFQHCQLWTLQTPNWLYRNHYDLTDLFRCILLLYRPCLDQTTIVVLAISLFSSRLQWMKHRHAIEVVLVLLIPIFHLCTSWYWSKSSATNFLWNYYLYHILSVNTTHMSWTTFPSHDLTVPKLLFKTTTEGSDERKLRQNTTKHHKYNQFITSTVNIKRTSEALKSYTKVFYVLYSPQHLHYKNIVLGSSNSKYKICVK